MLANASKHRALSYARMREGEEWLGKEIGVLFAAAKAADAAEDAQCGPERAGDALPEDRSGEIARRERRLATIRAAREALAREVRAEAEAIRAADRAERSRRAEAGEPKKPGRPPDPPGVPEGYAQRNFTDPDARIMVDADQAFVQAYTAQVAVDAAPHQISVGCAVTNQATDAPHLAPMVAQVRETAAGKPKEWSSDAGFFSAQNVGALNALGIESFIPPTPSARGRWSPCSGSSRRGGGCGGSSCGGWPGWPASGRCGA